jgi:hypothetical protein
MTMLGRYSGAVVCERRHRNFAVGIVRLINFLVESNTSAANG